MEEYLVIIDFNDATNKGKKYKVGDHYKCDKKRADFLMGKNKFKKRYIKPITKVETKIEDEEIKVDEIIDENEDTEYKREDKKSFRRRILD